DCYRFDLTIDSRCQPPRPDEGRPGVRGPGRSRASVSPRQQFWPRAPPAFLVRTVRAGCAGCDPGCLMLEPAVGRLAAEQADTAADAMGPSFRSALSRCGQAHRGRAMEVEPAQQRELLRLTSWPCHPSQVSPG